MKQIQKTEAILAGLELAIREVVKPENLNKWVSVRERSITKILKECEVNINYSSAFLEELRNVGLIETTSSGCGMKYMVRTLQIPDASFLARKIYDNFSERYAKGRVNDGYPTSCKSDLRPKRYAKESSTVGRSGAVRVIPREIASLGDIGYVVQDNIIKEAMVVGVCYDSVDRRHIFYTLETYRKDQDGREYYNVISNVMRRDFHKTIAEAVGSMPIHKYVKRK